ncbi:MAG: hypothetical protein Q9218_006968 [Villophora microphyllina]
MSTFQPPKLSVELSLSTTTYSYSVPDPPTLSLTITSNADRPITLLTFQTAFHPRSGMTHDCFRIWDLTTDSAVKTTAIRVQRMPLSRARGSGDEEYLLTLQPSMPTTVFTRFARGNENMRPLCKAQAEKHREEAIRNKTARRSLFACGVDGLEPGHRYEVSVSKTPLWWVWGTKEEILVDPGGTDWGLYNVSPEELVLEYGEIRGVELLVEG